MFPLTREILIYALGILIFLMVTLVFLIFRRRLPPGAPSTAQAKQEVPATEPKQEPVETEPQPAHSETGPIDLKSIKEKLLGEKHVETPPKAEPVPEKPVVPSPEVQPAPQAQPPEPVQESHPEPPEPDIQPPTLPKPPPEPTPEEEAREPVFQEGLIEQGVELHDHPEELVQEEEGKYGPPQPEPVPPVKKAQPPPAPVQQAVTPQPVAQQEEYVMLDDLEEESDKRPVKPAAPKAVKEKELVAKGIVKPQEEKGISVRLVPRPQPKDIEALKPRPPAEKPSEFSFKKVEGVETGIPVDSATITKDAKSFLGQTVAIEGDLQLSSKGKEDVWYVLFNKTGSSVVMSKEEIPLKRCRLFAKVEKTRLGQIYLNVTRYEKI